MPTAWPSKLASHGITVKVASIVLSSSPKAAQWLSQCTSSRLRGFSLMRSTYSMGESAAWSMPMGLSKATANSSWQRFNSSSRILRTIMLHPSCRHDTPRATACQCAGLA